MLNVEFVLNRINYEKTVDALYPKILAALETADSDNIAIRILKKIGDSSKPAVLSFMKSLRNEETTELLAYFVRSYTPIIAKKINDFLYKSGYGKAIHLGSVSVQTGQSGIRIYLCNVIFNYKELTAILPQMESMIADLGVKAAKIFSFFTPNFILSDAGDYALLKAFQRPDLAGKIIEMIRSVLEKNDICANLVEMRVAKSDDSTISPPATNNPDDPMPQWLADLLVKKVSTFIRSLLKGDTKGSSSGSSKQKPKDKPKDQPAKQPTFTGKRLCGDAFEQGSAEALNALGMQYCTSDSKKQDLVKAAQYFTLAAEQGYAAAQYNLGVCYDRGVGVDQDYGQAARWFTLAAEQGHADAQISLGLYCLDTDDYGDSPGNEQAARWFTLAAEQGHPNAQYNLGVCYENGLGVDRDDAKAVCWYRLAAEQGVEDAVEALKRF